MKVLPLFKSHYSLGRSILTLDKPTGKKDHYPTSIFDLLIQNKLSTLTLIEDNISGLMEASKIAAENKIKLVFGLKMDVCEDMTIKNEDALKKRAKYIIFARNTQGYNSLLKLWSIAAKDGFYYTPNIDFKTLKSYWLQDLMMAVPFYDSFLYLNAFESHSHVPQLNGFDPTFLIESNELPFDELLKQKVENYCQKKYNVLTSQSIYYKTADDFVAYLAFRCIHNRGMVQKSTLEKPELSHMCSDTFNFERWLKLNE